MVMMVMVVLVAIVFIVVLFVFILFVLIIIDQVGWRRWTELNGIVGIILQLLIICIVQHIEFFLNGMSIPLAYILENEIYCLRPQTWQEQLSILDPSLTRLLTCSFSIRTRLRRSCSDKPSQNSLIRSFSSAVVVFQIFRCRNSPPDVETPLDGLTLAKVDLPFFFFFLDLLPVVGVLLDDEEVAVIGIEYCDCESGGGGGGIGLSISTRSGISSSVKSRSSS